MLADDTSSHGDQTTSDRLALEGEDLCGMCRSSSPCCSPSPSAGPAAIGPGRDPCPRAPATPLAVPPATPSADLAGVAPLPLTGERRAAFEAYVAEAINRLGVAGASVAVVQGGEVVYAQGFGVRALGGTDPVTPDTLMMIGSVTKSMTSTMAATVVDDGWLSWDTPLVELLPDFAVADPQLTPRLTLADAFCACTGLPRRDLELMFHFNDLTPDRLIAQVAELPLTAPYGERSSTATRCMPSAATRQPLPRARPRTTSTVATSWRCANGS